MTTTARTHRGMTAALAATATLAFMGLTANEAPSLPALQATAAATTTVAADVAPSVRTQVATVGTAAVVVRTTAGAAATARDAVASTGGTVTVDLDLVHGFGATLTAAGLDLLESLPGVIAVSDDAAVEFLGKGGKGGGGSTTDGTADSGQTLVHPYDDYFSETIGAEVLKAAGIDGSGVGIAIIDTGIAEIPDLAGRIVHHQDLSSEANDVDGVGHGTFLAGLAAGDGTMSQTGSKRDPSYPHQGVAPGAHLIDVKVADAAGETNLITILAALQWVHHNRDIHDIDVVNLSFGTVSEQATNVDPLNYAVQQLWKDGIVVVTAAGNLGEEGSRTITKPADDPFVITVGASDSRGTILPADDQVPTFSSQGPTLADGGAKPDVVAPGRSVVGPIAPGSSVSLVTEAVVDTHYVRGSGTSFSAAVTSGAVALLLEAHPDWTPDQVKGALRTTATPIAELDGYRAGRGIVDIAAAAALANPPEANGGLLYGSPVGDVSYTLGDMADALLDQANCTVQGLLGLVGLGDPCEYWFELEQYVADFDATSWDATEFAGHAWYGHAWYGHAWYGQQWYGHAWYGHAWYGHAWYGHAWYSNDWQ